MLENYAQLSAFNELLRSRKLDRRAYASPDWAAARFRLGTSLAETKIPFFFDAPLESVLKRAIETLVLAVPMRHRGDMGPMELDAVLLQPAALEINLPPPTWYVGDVPPDSVYYRVITRSMLRNRRLDAGLLLWWFGKEGAGRALINELNRYVHKLEGEAKERGKGEDTLRLGLLAVVGYWAQFRSPVSDRAKHTVLTEGYNAAAVVLYEVLHGLLEERYRPMGIPERPIGDSAAAAYQALTLPLSPLAFAAGCTDFGADVLGPWGLSAGAIQILERFFPKMLERHTPVAEVAKQIAQKIGADRAAPPALLLDLRRQKIEEACIQLLWRLKPGDEKSIEAAVIHEVLRIRNDPDELLSALDDKKRSKEWQEVWKRLTTDAYRPQMDAFLAEMLSLAKLSEGFFSDKTALQNAYGEFAKRFVTLRHAEGLNEALLEAARFLQRFQGPVEKADGEWEQGRLYRFSADDNPVLKTGAAAKEAQLFIDLKDFTKRTFSSKELAMADFMKWEFYDPILKAGKTYMLDMAHLDNSGIAINNLLGDAVLASGKVSTLVRFAYDVIALTDEYRVKLKQKMPAPLVEQKLKETDEAFAKRKAALEAERNRYLAPAQKLTAELNALPPQDPKRAQLTAQIRGYQEAAGAAVRELKQATLDHSDKRALIEGTGLEAGAYIAFGNMAELITFNDEAFGNLRVAIGEKINESARGTAREGGVRDTLEYLVDRARAAAKNPEMEYPFRIFVDNTLRPVLDPDLEITLRQALAAKDAEAVKRAVTSLSQRLMNDLVAGVKKDHPEYRSVALGNGIYNLGLALSGDAVEAYVKDLEGRRQVVRRELVVDELHEEIKRRFVFPAARYPMILAAAESAERPVEVYVDLGSMVFKGFEKMEPQRIWECLLHKTLFYKLLAKHHFGQWLATAPR